LAGTAWNEKEIRAAIREYFKLLNLQLAGKQAIKSEIYAKLSTAFPDRSSKAFELKFQNVSAILYEENLPYVDGLKPKSNYQLLLKLLVLNHLNRIERPMISPKDFLVRQMRNLWTRGYLPVKEKGSGRFGLALERHLNILPNSSKTPDFMGIELKTKRDKSLQTLFSKVPTEYTGCKSKTELVENHGYFDKKRNRQALYTSFSSGGDSLGFSLKANNDFVNVLKNGSELLKYDCDLLEEALLSKHTESAYISVSTRKSLNNKQECRFDELIYCKRPSMRRFLKMIDKGDVYLDFTLSIKNKRVRDHGFLWRVKADAITDLYLSTENIDLRNSG